MLRLTLHHGPLATVAANIVDERSSAIASMREKILTVAEHLMRTEGLAHATTRRIATQAGCSEGTIYRHFKGKEEVFLAVLSERMPEFLPMMRSILEKVGKGDIGGNLATVMNAALAFYRATIPITAAIFAEPQLLDNYRAWMRDNRVGPNRAVELLADYIAGEQDAYRLARDINPVAAADALLGACYLRAYSGQFADMVPGTDSKFIADTVALFLRGMSAGHAASAS
jgi:AcrR family transcriptional regulator